MAIETDPAETPEDTTAADLPAEEAAAESTETETAEDSETSDDQGKAEEKPEEIEVVIDGEPAKVDEPAPKDSRAWSKAREEARELKAKIAQLERQAQARAQPATDDPGPKPTIESCAWDEERKDRELIAWHEKSKAYEAKKVASAQADAERKRSWAQTVEVAEQSRAEAMKRMPLYLEYEATAINALRSAGLEFDPLAAIVDALEDKKKYPAVMAALGRDPARLKDFVETKGAGRLYAKVSKLEDKVQMKEKSKGTTPPPPEGKPKGTGSASSGAVDHERERLLDAATKSGNINALRAYDKAKRKK